MQKATLFNPTQTGLEIKSNCMFNQEHIRAEGLRRLYAPVQRNTGNETGIWIQWNGLDGMEW